MKSPPSGLFFGMNILFFDGTCGLCHRSLRLLNPMLHKESTLRFCPLDSERARKHLGPQAQSSPTVVYLKENQSYTKTAAILALASELRWPYRILVSLLKSIPRRLADAAYDWIAQRRKKFFPEACSLEDAKKLQHRIMMER